MPVFIKYIIFYCIGTVSKKIRIVNIKVLCKHKQVVPKPKWMNIFKIRVNNKLGHIYHKYKITSKTLKSTKQFSWMTTMFLVQKKN